MFQQYLCKPILILWGKSNSILEDVIKFRDAYFIREILKSKQETGKEKLGIGFSIFPQASEHVNWTSHIFAFFEGRKLFEKREFESGTFFA